MYAFAKLDATEEPGKLTNMALVVGVIFPAKKIERLLNVLREERDGVRFVLIDLYDPSAVDAATIERASGRVDALLHKLAHEMVFSRLGDADADKRLCIVDEYLARNPHVKVIDPLASVRLLTDRLAACETATALASASGSDAVQFRVPKFRVVDGAEQLESFAAAVDAGEMALPLICKSVEACATKRSHMMSVITKREDLQLVEYPEFINHSGRLFKGYVLGDLINVAERRSLPNLVAGSAQRVHFDTQQKYPTTEDFHPQTPEDRVTESASGGNDFVRTQEQIFEAVRAIGARFRDELQLSLFGFDVIIDDKSGDFLVIDVNYFPSYKELEDFDQVLRRHICQLCGR